MERFVDYCKDVISDYMEEHEGYEYGRDVFGFMITQNENNNGSLTCNRAKDMEYLLAWWNDAAAFFNHELEEFGRPSNPFASAESYVVCMVIEGVNAILRDSRTLNALPDTFTLSRDVIDGIYSDMEEVEEVRF